MREKMMMKEKEREREAEERTSIRLI